MSVSIINQPEIIQPVYSIQEYNLYDSANSGVEDLYYRLIVNIEGETRQIEQYPDVNGECKIDVQSILQSFFESNILTHSDFIVYNYSGLLSYDVSAYSIANGTTYTIGGDTKYIFNGIDKYNRSFDLSTYIWDGGESEFLTNWSSSRDIHLEDDVYVQFLSGTFGSITSSINSIKVKKYNKDGTTNYRSISLSFGTTPRIISVNIGPTSLNNTLTGIAIDENVNYYEITADGGNSLTYKINIKSKDSRYDKYHRIYYVGDYGETEAFNFDLTDANSLTIKRTTYKNDNILKTFGTSAQDKYEVYSNWMCEETSKALKELWTSPKTELYLDDIYIPIILNESSKRILNRKNVPLINYKVSYTYAESYIIQTQ